MTASRAHNARALRGHRNHVAGMWAEDSVAEAYAAHGYPVVARRWRGKAGEIDLIVRARTGYIFVEVKRAQTHDAAAERLRPAQVQRLFRTADDFVAARGEYGIADMRFDVALVDGAGRMKVLQNALAGDLI